MDWRSRETIECWVFLPVRRSRKVTSVEAVRPTAANAVSDPQAVLDATSRLERFIPIGTALSRYRSAKKAVAEPGVDAPVRG